MSEQNKVNAKLAEIVTLLTDLVIALQKRVVVLEENATNNITIQPKRCRENESTIPVSKVFAKKGKRDKSESKS